MQVWIQKNGKWALRRNEFSLLCVFFDEFFLEKLEKDINECENSDICPLGNSCENTVGSYKCNCDQPGWFFVEDICVQGSICDSFTNICGDEMICSDVEINGQIRDYECKSTATTTTVTEKIETTVAMETTTSAFLKISMNMIIFFVSFILLQ